MATVLTMGDLHVDTDLTIAGELFPADASAFTSRTLTANVSGTLYRGDMVKVFYSLDGGETTTQWGAYLATGKIKTSFTAPEPISVSTGVATDDIQVSVLLEVISDESPDFSVTDIQLSCDTGAVVIGQCHGSTFGF